MNRTEKLVPLYENIKQKTIKQKINEETKKVIEYISNIFSSKKEDVGDISFTNSKLIKENKLKNDIEEAKKLFTEILNFAKNAPNLPKETIIEQIKQYRGKSGRQVNKIENSIDTLRAEQPDFVKNDGVIYDEQLQKEQTQQKNKFLETPEMIETENIKSKLKKLENIFQNIRMKQKQQFKPNFISTLRDLDSVLNQDIYYTTKSKNEKIKAKITNITEDRKNNEIVFELDMAGKKNFSFPVGFKKDRSIDVVSIINSHFEIAGPAVVKEPINREQITQEIETIIDKNPKKINISEYNQSTRIAK